MHVAKASRFQLAPIPGTKNTFVGGAEVGVGVAVGMGVGVLVGVGVGVGLGVGVKVGVGDGVADGCGPRTVRIARTLDTGAGLHRAGGQGCAIPGCALAVGGAP